MSTPNSEMPHATLNGAEKFLLTEAQLPCSPVDAEVMTQMNARILQLESVIRSQQETISHHQNFMDKQLSLVMPQNVPATPVVTPEDIPSKITKHPVGSAVLAYYLIGTTGAIAASLISYVRHSPDTTCAALLLVGATLSFLSTAYVIFSMIRERTINPPIRILPNLSMGLSCIIVLAALMHLFWYVCSHISHGRTLFWDILLVQVGIVVLVSLARSTLGIALRPVFERSISRLSNRNPNEVSGRPLAN